jgi:NTE family protein
MTKKITSRTAFVFAGGGSLGAVEVGMLKALVSRGVHADLVVGASVGAINAAYFAGDPSVAGVAQLEALWRGIRRRDVFPMGPFINLLGLFAWRDYVVNPQALRNLLARHLPYRHLEEAQIPCHVVATDALGGSEVRFSSGLAAERLLASAAIPGVFPPVRIAGQYLLDGGIANNTPISTAVELGATRVIVLPTGFSCALDRPPPGALAVALHALNLLIARQLVRDTEQFSSAAELVIVPPLCPTAASAYDFSTTGTLIDRAADATISWLDRNGLQAGDIPGALRPHVDDVVLTEEPGPQSSGALCTAATNGSVEPRGSVNPVRAPGQVELREQVVTPTARQGCALRPAQSMLDAARR